MPPPPRPPALLLLCAAMAAAQSTAPFFHKGAIRALILSGRNNHDWRATTPQLRRILVDTGRFDVRVDEEPAGITAATLDAYDVLILDYNGPRWGETAEAAVEAFVRSGKGMVAVHGACYAFADNELLFDNHVKSGIREKPWPAYAAMLGGAWVEASGHGQRHVFPVKFVDRQHAIAQELEATFLANDELYHRLKLSPQAHVLATAFDAEAIGGTGKDEPVLWTVAYGQGRVFNTTLGHDVTAMMEKGFAETFARGAEWAASGAVKPAEPVRKPPQTRVLLVTGGHSHETSFYGVFDGQSDLAVTVDPHPAAFANDLRPDYDVIVFYDMIQDLPDVRKKHLQDFAESGKGLVVMHHAIADFNDWKWWWEELVGGKYFLKAEEGHAASTYKHDQDMVVSVVAKHPITDGLSPMHLIDEAYQGVWISPQSQVLLKTDHPLSDGPVAWITPYRKSRVVYIMLGHGREAHEQPQFRQLVRNAVKWAAGR
jgi:type 1 glutamine amidotransferase